VLLLLLLSVQDNASLEDYLSTFELELVRP